MFNWHYLFDLHYNKYQRYTSNLIEVQDLSKNTFQNIFKNTSNQNKNKALQ